MSEEQTDELARALAGLQAHCGGVKKTGKNPHFRSEFTTLADAWAVVRPALVNLGLAIVQWPVTDLARELAGVRTEVMHASGQSRTSELLLPIGGKPTAQSVGSAITYARRYSLLAICGVADDDDDGHAATEAAKQSRSSGPGRTNAARGDSGATEAKKRAPAPLQSESAEVGKREQLKPSGNFSKTGCMGCGGLVGGSKCPGPAKDCKQGGGLVAEIAETIRSLRELGAPDSVTRTAESWVNTTPRPSNAKLGAFLARLKEMLTTARECDHPSWIPSTEKQGFDACAGCGVERPDGSESMAEAMGVEEEEVPF